MNERKEFYDILRIWKERKREKIVWILVYICLNNIEKSDTSSLSLLPQKTEEKGVGGQVE